MAKRHLEQYDKNGNMLDIYLNEDEVMVGDQTLAEKLADMEDDIDDAAQTGGEGTVTGIKVGSNTYEPTEGVVDISGAIPTSTSDLSNNSDFTTKAYVDAAVQAVQTALNNLMNGQSVTDAIDTFNEIVDFLDDIDTDDPTLANQLLALNNSIKALQTALAGKISGIKTSDNTPLTPDSNGIVTLPPAGSTISPATAAPLEDGTASVGSSAKYAREDHVHPHDSTKLSKSDVSVETQGDGTVDINIKDDTYTINLNHTHEGMAKLVKCTEATLPQTMADDTIYVQVDNLTTPSEIEALHIFGLEFTGGGAAPGVPYLSSPGANISMGDSENGSVTKAIRVKGRFLTQALSASLIGTGYAFGTTQPTGVTRNSDTSLTITADAAKAGVDISVVYTGTAFNATGTLAITSSSPDNIDTESTLLANELDTDGLNTDGLIAYWNASDAPSSGAWVDRINSMKLNLGGTATQDSGGYRLNNLSAPRNAWLYCDSSHISLLNSEIDKEFTCIIDCEVKFTAASKKAMIIDFGGFGTTTGGLAVNAKVSQEGTLGCGAKKGNTAITAQANDVQIPAFTLDTYIPIRMTCGIRVASNGTQVIYSKIGTAEAYSYNTPAIQVNLQGADLNYPFGAGIVYMTGYGLNYATDYLADVIYKSIIIYNKKV